MFSYKWIAPLLSIIGAICVSAPNNTMNIVGFSCWIVANIVLMRRFAYDEDTWMVVMYFIFTATSVAGVLCRVPPAT